MDGLTVPLIDHWMDTIHLALVVVRRKDGVYSIIRRGKDTPDTGIPPECVAGQRFGMCFHSYN